MRRRVCGEMAEKLCNSRDWRPREARNYQVRQRPKVQFECDETWTDEGERAASKLAIGMSS